MKKWYNVELKSKEWDLYRKHLKETKMQYNVSGIDFEWRHVEIYCSPEELQIENSFLETL